jgi:hypothetical protein
MQLQTPIPVVVWLATLCTLVACEVQPARHPSYSISVSGAGNRVTYAPDDSTALFEVRSETGLGSAEVEQTAGATPPTMWIRLYLGGLEEFDFEYDDSAVVVSVSSHGNQTVSERMRTTGSDESPIAPDSPYWLPVRIVASPASGEQSSTGYFEVQAPQDYIQGKHRSFAMRWIDFYR